LSNQKAKVLIEAVHLAPTGLIVEIGCIRQDREVPEDGFSTIYLAKFTHQNTPFYTFRSFDNSESTCIMANRVLGEHDLPYRVEWQDGKEAVKEVGPIGFLYLDSHKDPFFSFEQYKAAELVPGAIVAIDDTHRIDQYKFGKATLLIQVFEARDIKFEIVPTFENENYKTGMTIAKFPEGKQSGVV